VIAAAGRWAKLQGFSSGFVVRVQRFASARKASRQGCGEVLGSTALRWCSRTDEVIAGAMASAEFLPKSSGSSKRHEVRLLGLCFAVAAQTTNRGPHPCPGHKAGEEAPTTLWAEIGGAGLQDHGS